MKQKMIRTTAVLLLLATLIGLLPVFGATVQATLIYSTSSNSGQRDVLCTTLDGTSAEDYYTGEYAYDSLSELSADDLYDALAELMTGTHKKLTSYNDCKNYANKTDCQNNDQTVLLLYTSFATTADKIGSSGAVWNREHVWPKSLGGFETTGAGSDLHHIRPADSRVNTVRNNNLYGEVNGGKPAYASALVGTSVCGGYYAGGYFEPLDNVKGDVARICLYLYVRWAEEYPQCSDITHVFQSVDVLLDWCEQDPVDTWEMGRNEVVGAIQGNRNVFIDYPEYAWLIFDREVPADMTTPSGEAFESNGGNPACAHKNIEVKNASAATCGKAGYTGDTTCKDCGKLIVAGSTLPATGNHTFGEWIIADDGSKSHTCTVCGKTEAEAAGGCIHSKTEIRGAIAATCGKAGYSGDIHCADCDKLIVAGSTLPATGNHTFGEWITADDGSKSHTCTVCGKTEAEAAGGCIHSKTEIRGAIAATCGKAGYSGDIHCADCDKLIVAGSTLPATGNHTFGEWITADDGSKSRTCTVCGKTETETAPFPTVCPHTHTEVRGAVPATCTEGYSGDTYCVDCGELLIDGAIAPTIAPHSYGDPTPIEGTDLEKRVCMVCGHELVDKIAADKPSTDESSAADDSTTDSDGSPILWIIALSLSGLAVVAIIAVILLKKKKSSNGS
ncbi:MAG: endonuclease I family protein [Eubacteriales bacterium]